MGLHIVAHPHIFVVGFGQLGVLQHVKRYRLAWVEPSTVVLVGLWRLVHLALSDCSFTFNRHRVLRWHWCTWTLLIIPNYRMSLEDILPGLVQILYIAFVNLLFHVLQILLLSGGRITPRLIAWLRVRILLHWDFPADSILTRGTQTGRIRGAAWGLFDSFRPRICCLAIWTFIGRVVSLRNPSADKKRLLLLKLLLFC